MGPKYLFHADGFKRALVDTNPAIHAAIGVNTCLVILHLDGFAGARINTRTATGANPFIHFRRHTYIPFISSCFYATPNRLGSLQNPAVEYNIFLGQNLEF
jgi:hypothetical protein